MNVDGILPAVITPFTSSGGVDMTALERLIARLYAAGVDGLYMCGQTGEGLAQSVSMRKLALEVALAVSPAGKSVIAHVGSIRMEDAIDLARHASAKGATAISSLPPVGAFSYEEISAWYRALAEVSDVPLILYYYPEAAPGLSSAQVVELCSLPNVAGVKFTSFELHRIAEINQAGAFVLNGRDEVLAAGVLMGARGGIGSFYNLAPELFVGIWDAARRGQWSEARSLQDRVGRLIQIVLGFPMIPAIKMLLGWSGVPCGPALGPRRALKPYEEGALRQELEQAGFDPCGFLAGVRA
jgi:N-acetylneuraminate lyase